MVEQVARVLFPPIRSVVLHLCEMFHFGNVVRLQFAQDKSFIVMSNKLPGGGGVLPIMAYTGRLRPKGVPFSGFRYMKG